ncbi:MAG: hypothetical protein VXZ82_01075 [Planctomycetota bacterium]|nr:hypothetical protein [Planctomycetota bacterium]
MTEAIGRLSHDLQRWSDAVEEVREQWLWDHSEAELPENYLTAFGWDNELSRERLRILDAMQRLVDHLRARPKPKSDSSDEISRKDLLAFLKIKGNTLNTRMDKNGFPKPCRKDGRKHYFSISAVEKWQKQWQKQQDSKKRKDKS